jgi:membrane associated rhomboid family serine protease
MLPALEWSLGLVTCVALVSGVALVVPGAGDHLASWFGNVGGRWTTPWTAFTAPFLHANWPHLGHNLISLALFGFLAAWRRGGSAWRPWVGAAIGAWIVIALVGNPDHVHVGASILIYGCMADAVLIGFRRKEWSAWMGSIILVFLFGVGLLVALVPWLQPVERGVSWEGHLGGALGGVITAWTMPKQEM